MSNAKIQEVGANRARFPKISTIPPKGEARARSTRVIDALPLGCTLMSHLCRDRHRIL